MIESSFRPVRHLKMTVWTSVLWNIVIQLPKKWLETVLKWPFIIIFHFRSDVTMRKEPRDTLQCTAHLLNNTNLYLHWFANQRKGRLLSSMRCALIFELHWFFQNQKTAEPGVLLYDQMHFISFWNQYKNKIF